MSLCTMLQFFSKTSATILLDITFRELQRKLLKQFSKIPIRNKNFSNNRHEIHDGEVATLE